MHQILLESFCGFLDQASANPGAQVESSLHPIFVNKVLLETAMLTHVKNDFFFQKGFNHAGQHVVICDPEMLPCTV